MAKFCINCGNSIDENLSVCNYCGASVSQPVAQPAPQPAPVYVQQTAAVFDGEKPVSIGQWIGYFFLTAIPVVGFILLIVMACGGLSQSTSAKNWARAQLIISAIVIALYILLFVIIGVSAASMGDYFGA